MSKWLLEPAFLKTISFLVIVYLAEASRRAIHHARGPRERAFTTRAVIISWLATAGLIAISASLPLEWVWLPTGLFLIVGPVAILAVRRSLLSIQTEEGLPERTGTERIVPKSEPVQFA